jgi:hypothetical protein
MDLPRLFTLRHDILKIYVQLQIAFPAETNSGEGQLVTYIPSRNANADCFEGRGVIFSATKDTY